MKSIFRIFRFFLLTIVGFVFIASLMLAFFVGTYGPNMVRQWVGDYLTENVQMVNIDYSFPFSLKARDVKIDNYLTADKAQLDFDFLSLKSFVLNYFDKGEVLMLPGHLQVEGLMVASQVTEKIQESGEGNIFPFDNEVSIDSDVVFEVEREDFKLTKFSFKGEFEVFDEDE